MTDKTKGLITGHGLTRRAFVQTFALAGATLSFPTATAAGRDELLAQFASPPDSARMWTWWFWLDDWVDAASITADLEELRLKGMAGVTVYSLNSSGSTTTSRGPNYMGSEWRIFQTHRQRGRPPGFRREHNAVQRLERRRAVD